MNRAQQAKREAATERRQMRCDHVWHHEFATIHNRLVASTWCRKCKITAFRYSMQKRGAR